MAHNPLLALLDEALESLKKGFAHLPDVRETIEIEKVRAALLSAAERMRDNFPYQHPLLIGQMLRPPHPVAPLAEIVALRQRYDFRIHVDAAYGGYFKLADNLGNNGREAFARIGEVDSIVVDPHKHGLQPYGCGCVLFRDPSVGKFYRHDS